MDDIPSLDDPVADHGVEDDLDVLRQGGVEVIRLSRVHYPGPGERAVPRVEQACLGDGPLRSEYGLRGSADRCPNAGVVAVEAAPAIAYGDFGAGELGLRSLDAGDPRDQHAFGARPGDGLAQLRFFDLTALADGRVARNPFYPSLGEQRDDTVLVCAPGDFVRRHRHHHDALERLADVVK